MSAAHGLDVRVPIGGLFTALGLIVSVFGVATSGDTDRYARSLSINVNLWWGLVMLVFGILLLLASRGARSAMHPADETPEGRATERRERNTGLEK
jgi:hypothetical protein